MGRRLTNKEFNKRIFTKFNGGIVPQQIYHGASKKIAFKCDHGHIFRASPHHVYHFKGNGCPVCNYIKENKNNRKTTKQFKQDVYNRYGNLYIVLGEYINNNTPIKVKHRLCGKTFYILPRALLSNGINDKSHCPYCCKRRLKTTTEFKHEVWLLVGDEYTVLGIYKGSSIKIKMRHNKCGKVYYVRPYSFLEGSRCPYCSMCHHKSTKEFKKQVYLQVGNEYTILSEYKGSKIKIKVRHNKCGFIYWVAPESFLSGTRCPKCAYKREAKIKTKTTKWFKRKMLLLTGHEYTLLSPYLGWNTKVKIRHNKCGNIFWMAPHNFLAGDRCPRCGYEHAALEKTYTTTDYKRTVFQLVGNEYIVIGKYKGYRKLILMKHVKCGNTFYTRPVYFIRGNRCPYCKSSTGEKCIAAFLNQYNIKFIHSFLLHTDSRKNKCLHLDFYLPSLNIGIEFDGVQHFTPIDFSGHLTKHQSYLHWKNYHKRDIRKNKYCKDHKILLLRIQNKNDNKNKKQIKAKVFKILKHKLL